MNSNGEAPLKRCYLFHSTRPGTSTRWGRSDAALPPTPAAQKVIGLYAPMFPEDRTNEYGPVKKGE